MRLDRTELRRDEIFAVEVVNTRDTYHLSGGWDFWYERLREDGAWERVGADYLFPGIAVGAPPCGSLEHYARVGPELQPGRHRLVKPLSSPYGPSTLSAEFDVVP